MTTKNDFHTTENSPAPKRRGRPATAPTDGAEVQSLDRAMALLDVLAGGEGLPLSEIARRAELPASTVHRLLATLHRRDLVGHEADTGLWTVGVGLFRIGSAYLRIRKLPLIARPLLRVLMEEVGETTNVCMLDGVELVCVAQAEAHAPVRAFFRLGLRLPVHASAAGKAILSVANGAIRQQLLGTAPLPGFTPGTLTGRTALLADVAQAAARGWTVDDEEHTLGMRCVAAPILNEWAEPAGAISVSAPTVRMPSDRLPSLGPRVAAVAAELSRLYSGRQA